MHCDLDFAVRLSLDRVSAVFLRVTNEDAAL